MVYRYPYDRAVREGYLVDHDAVKISSDVRMNGIFLNEGEQVGLIDTVTGAEQLDLLEDERQFDITEVERRVTSPDSNRKIIEEIRKYAVEHEQQYGRFPKTLIFAVNDLEHTSHADQQPPHGIGALGVGERQPDEHRNRFGEMLAGGTAVRLGVGRVSGFGSALGNHAGVTVSVTGRCPTM